MKVFDLSEVSLAIILAVSTTIGGILASAVNKIWIDANIDKETDVQLVELAISILSKPVEQGSMIDTGSSPDRVLRQWAVDTINAAAEVRFDDEAQKLPVDQGRNLNVTSDVNDLISAIEELRRPGLYQRSDDLVEPTDDE